MPALMKMPLTEVRIDTHLYRVPTSKAMKLLKEFKDYEITQTTDSLTADEVFKDLHAKNGKVGTLIKGLRYRENMTQVALAKKIHVTQGDLSKMENGTRPIGKEIARRFAKIFKTDYRIFL